MVARPIISAFAALSLLALAGSAPAPAGPRTYSVAAIRKMGFEGLHLGMTHQAACERLIALGFIRHPTDMSSGGCGPGWKPDPDSDEGEPDMFYSPKVIGPVPGPAPGAPGSMLSKVTTVDLRLIKAGGTRIVTEILVDVTDPDKGAATVAAMARKWGAPTRQYDWGYVTWATSMEAAAYENQGDFLTCMLHPVCEHHKRGKDCVRIFQRFADPHVEITRHAFGYTIRFSDGLPYVDQLRRTDGFAKLEREAARTICVESPAEMM